MKVSLSLTKHLLSKICILSTTGAIPIRLPSLTGLLNWFCFIFGVLLIPMSCKRPNWRPVSFWVHIKYFPLIWCDLIQYELGVCGKLKFCLNLDFKNPNRIRAVQKFDILADGFLTETACNPKFKLKVTKITLLAFSVQIKNVLKHDRNRV